MATATIQVFGRRDSRDTQRAQRFFKERRIPVSFVDLAARPMAPTELRRFAQRLGVEALIDHEGRPYRDLGLAWLRLSDDEWLARLLVDQRLLRLPLVRSGDRVSVAADQSAWGQMAQG